MLCQPTDHIGTLAGRMASVGAQPSFSSVPSYCWFAIRRPKRSITRNVRSYMPTIICIIIVNSIINCYGHRRKHNSRETLRITIQCIRSKLSNMSSYTLVPIILLKLNWNCRLFDKKHIKEYNLTHYITIHLYIAIIYEHNAINNVERKQSWSTYLLSFVFWSKRTFESSICTL